MFLGGFGGFSQVHVTPPSSNCATERALAVERHVATLLCHAATLLPIFINVNLLYFKFVSGEIEAENYALAK
jgi:hypothetical protein